MPDRVLEPDVDASADQRRSDRRAARQRRRRRSQRVVLVVAAVSALAGALADGAPTGIDGLDLLYRAAFAFLIPVAGSRARRWTWFVVAGAAGAASTEQLLPFSLAGTAMAVTFGAVISGHRRRQLGAVVGALAVQSLLRLPTDLPFAVPTVVAALAPLPVLLSALRQVRRPRRYVRAASGLAALLVVVGAAFGVGMLSIDDRASDGIEAVRAAITAARDGDDAAAEHAFAQAEAELADAADTAGSWWLAPARAVPVLAHHVRAVEEVAGEARALAGLSADQVATLDITGLARPGGGLDLERMADLQPRAETVADALRRAGTVIDDASSEWLAPPAADRLEAFADEVASALPAAENAAEALEVAPYLLGADAPRRYVVLVGNPAEARELGGFVAATGTLTADDGDLRFEAIDGIGVAAALIEDAGVAIDPSNLPPPLRSSGVNRFPQNWTNSADPAAVAEVATALAPGFVGAPVDGVLYLDPYAVASLLELTGPVPLEGIDVPLTAANAPGFLLREQYLRSDFAGDGSRKDRLRDAAEAALERLASSVPDPRRMADALHGAVRARRLLFTTTDDRPHPLLTRLGLRPPLDVPTTDQILVAQQNLRPNKIDAYLQRHLRYDVTIDDAGNLSGTLTVELTNTAPPGGLGTYVTGDAGEVPEPNALNETSVALYTPFEVMNVTVDGFREGTNTARVGDLWRVGVPVDVPAESTVVVVWELRGVVDPDEYSVSFVPNATANVDTVEATIEVAGRTETLERRPLQETHRLRVDGTTRDT